MERPIDVKALSFFPFVAPFFSCGESEREREENQREERAREREKNSRRWGRGGGGGTERTKNTRRGLFGCDLWWW
jgi:hypothetical protein